MTTTTTTSTTDRHAGHWRTPKYATAEAAIAEIRRMRAEYRELGGRYPRLDHHRDLRDGRDGESWYVTTNFICA